MGLVEVVVAAGIMLLVTFAASGMLSAGLAYQSSQLGQADVQRAITNALSPLCDELSEADPACVAVSSSPSGVVFASPRDGLGRFSYDSGGALLWRGYVCYYLDTVGDVPVLVRKWTPLTVSVNDPPAVPASMTCAWFKGQPLPRRVFGGRALGFGVSGLNPLQLTLTMGSSGGHSMTVATQVCLRN